jgi:RNA polymerase sigma factor (sigma-70 family)
VSCRPCLEQVGNPVCPVLGSLNAYIGVNKNRPGGGQNEPLIRSYLDLMTSADTKRRLTNWFHQWRTPLRRFLLGRAGVTVADVEDVAQEVFLRLMRYDKGELVEHPQAYLYKVAANVATEWSIRARNRQPHEEKWLSGLIDREQPEDQLERVQSEREIERALNTLTPYQRQVLKLYFVDGKAYAEIATELGESLRSITRQFRKSYHKLRHELDPESLGVTHGRE